MNSQCEKIGFYNDLGNKAIPPKMIIEVIDGNIKVAAKIVCTRFMTYSVRGLPRWYVFIQSFYDNNRLVELQKKATH